ncbi:hypothetical protein RB601_006026 [Gaeumannomyces tritici]
MGIRGANNIDGGGMLIVMPGLATLELSPDGKRVDLGPALKWGAVYKHLAQHNLTAPGGRLSPVGVPGLLLGGGVSFIGNQVGWAADNVVEYEVVLASGDVVKVNKDASPDLFWALKGGSANFGIVTKFTVNTFPSTTVYAGTYTVSAAHGPAFLDAIANYTSGAVDPLSHMAPMVVPAAPGSAPECFREFLALPAVSTTMGLKTGKLVVDKINDVFIAGTTVGHDYESQRRGIEITNRVYNDAAPALWAAVGGADKIALTSIDWQPIDAVWQEASERQNPAGNALGVDPKSKGTYLVWAMVVEWFDGPAGVNEAVDAWCRETTAAIEAATKAAGLYGPFNHMGDAAGFQDVYTGYGAANKQKLLDVSRKYDSERVFQKLWPGGFKIGA